MYKTNAHIATYDDPGDDEQDSSDDDPSIEPSVLPSPPAKRARVETQTQQPTHTDVDDGQTPQQRQVNAQRQQAHAQEPAEVQQREPNPDNGRRAF
ncbi:hypothetical protein N7471_013188 [Penicillium samsonianum]|uniref:uncharacterized protein n=1 Tax=Penicillium samsonianum TaxID=1882272 RepID=UPI0025496BEB|nr:uncharacterized protein N7471_013188 [Penicillium samsonianum]KAJ6118568.1 hypothetical protein N7471_013188 [Penicillium samsonianum]